jgi:hypothetical protein
LWGHYALWGLRDRALCLEVVHERVQHWVQLLFHLCGHTLSQFTRQPLRVLPPPGWLQLLPLPSLLAWCRLGDLRGFREPSHESQALPPDQLHCIFLCDGLVLLFCGTESIFDSREYFWVILEDGSDAGLQGVRQWTSLFAGLPLLCNYGR